MKQVFLLKNVQKFASFSHWIRPISTKSVKLESTEPKLDEPKEVKIDVPWGYVAGKWYGSQDVRPILMLHGWQDNAGTFDRLVPLLPKHISYLTIDLPGHGLSSRLPHGIQYTTTNFINVVNIIRRHYKWDHLSMCGHSMGGHISTLFASLYPDKCDLIVCLDALMRPNRGKIDYIIEVAQKIGDDFLDLDELNRLNKEPPTYTQAEMIERWSKQSKMPPEGVEYLMKRGIAPSKANKNLFYFTRDVRLKIIELGMANITDDIMFHLIRRIKAPHLFIKASKSNEFEGKKEYVRALEVLIESNPKFEWRTVVGGHHCHLTDPTFVSDHISNFINKYRAN